MPLQNKITIASAGSGKTTSIVKRVLDNPDQRALITTFTLSNAAEVRRKFHDLNGIVPEMVSVVPWFTFVLREMVRPYQNLFYRPNRIRSVNLVSGRSDIYAPKADQSRYFFGNGEDVYSDKLSELALCCDEKSGGKVISRLEQSLDAIYIDEVQDLAGYDLDILFSLLNSELEVTMIGDHRQATLATNQSAKYKKYRYAGVIDLFREWEKKGLANLDFNAVSYRCCQQICDFADSLFPSEPSANSENNVSTDHDGIFIVRSNDVASYVAQYAPQVLRYNKVTKCDGYPAMNFRVSKGLTFERTLIYPHKSIREYLSSGELEKLKEPHLLYVAVTRARQSVAFVFDGECTIDGVKIYTPT
jgi:DNA helicase-2/ATP-dependent DNA helicase PcrA